MRSWSRRVTAITFVLAIAATLLSGCGGSASSGGVVNLTFWSFNPPIQKQVDLFNSTHSNIHVTYTTEPSGFGQYYPKILAAQRAGNAPDVALIDLREKSERERTGAISGSVHAPYGELQDNIGDGGLIHELARSGKTIVFYCAFGERSAMAVQAAQDQGLASARHIEVGMLAWKKAGVATH